MIWETSQNDFIKNLTPTLNLLNELKNTPTETPKSLVLKESCEDRKKTLEEQLSKWINIHNEQEFNAIIWLLVKNWIIKETLKLENLKDNDWKSLITSKSFRNIILSLKKIPQNPDKINVYITTPPRFYETDIFPRTGFINSNWKFEYSPDNNFFSYDDSITPNKNSWTIPEDIWQCTPEEKLVKPIAKKEATPDETPLEYKIKSWDSLWKIISEKYWLKPEWDKNAIWNIMEIIRNNPKNKKAIKDIDTIFIWKILYLPKYAKFKNKWVEKTINIKET